MTPQEYFGELLDFYAHGMDVMRAKNADYADKEDPFKNFRASELVGVDPARAILVRITDKLARVSNLLDNEAMVDDEKIEDTLLDMANYINILHAYLQQE